MGEDEEPVKVPINLPFHLICSSVWGSFGFLSQAPNSRRERRETIPLPGWDADLHKQYSHLSLGGRRTWLTRHDHIALYIAQVFSWLVFDSTTSVVAAEEILMEDKNQIGFTCSLRI